MDTQTFQITIGFLRSLVRSQSGENTDLIDCKLEHQTPSDHNSPMLLTLSVTSSTFGDLSDVFTVQNYVEV